jgi:hypothetical protein
MCHNNGMINSLKLIFIHGIDSQTTNYSQQLYQLVLAQVRNKLEREGHAEPYIQDMLRRLVHHEVLWANLTTDLTNRYLQLAYERNDMRWSFLTRRIDPLAIQIMQYIKDKGDKPTGRMDILRQVAADIDSIFAADDIGTAPPEARRKHALIIGHSLGSVIAYDYVMGFREHRLPPDVTVHNFITMGSPISIFTSAMGHPDSDLVLPSGVRHWTNIRSRADGVARPLKPFFRQVPLEEHLVSTGFMPIKAHGGYWKSRPTADVIARAALRALKEG